MNVFTVRTGAGLNLLIGNNEGAWKSAQTFDLNIYPTNSAEEAKLFYQLGEVAYDRRCSELAKAFIREHPGKFVDLTLRKIREWWLGYTTDWSGKVHRLGFSFLSALLKLSLVPLFVIGAIAGWWKKKPAGLLLALVLIYPVPYYVFFVLPRYRFPTEPFMLLFATYGVITLGHLLVPAGARLVRIRQVR